LVVVPTSRRKRLPNRTAFHVRRKHYISAGFWRWCVTFWFIHSLEFDFIPWL